MVGLPREARCPNGHQLGAGQLLVGHRVCLGHDGGPTTWTCRTCDPTADGSSMFDNSFIRRSSKHWRLRVSSVTCVQPVYAPGRTSSGTHPSTTAGGAPNAAHAPISRTNRTVPDASHNAKTSLSQRIYPLSNAAMSVRTNISGNRTELFSQCVAAAGWTAGGRVALGGLGGNSSDIHQTAVPCHWRSPSGRPARPRASSRAHRPPPWH